MWKEAKCDVADLEDSERGVAGKEAGWGQISMVEMCTRQLWKVLVLAIQHSGILSLSKCLVCSLESLNTSVLLSFTFFIPRCLSRLKKLSGPNVCLLLYLSSLLPQLPPVALGT